MLSLRSLSRAKPTIIKSFTNYASRPFLRTAAAKQPVQLVSRSRIGPKPFAAFSTTSFRQTSEGTVNEELAAKIESELSLEVEMRDPKAFPEHLKEYLDNSPFQLQDKPGQEEVVMTRTYGDETIKITFSIDDVNNVDADEDPMENDQSILDELDDASNVSASAQSGGASTKGAVNRGHTRDGNVRVAPEDQVAPADRPELDEGEQEEYGQEPSFPSHLYVTIDKASKGSLQIEVVAQDGLIVIENVYFFKDGKLANPKTHVEAEAASNLYTGPPFGNLDEDLQLLFERYLEERGINTTLALFVPEYIDFKEQREYLSWLEDVKTFVE